MFILNLHVEQYKEGKAIVDVQDDVIYLHIKDEFVPWVICPENDSQDVLNSDQWLNVYELIEENTEKSIIVIDKKSKEMNKELELNLYLNGFKIENGVILNYASRMTELKLYAASLQGDIYKIAIDKISNIETDVKKYMSNTHEIDFTKCILDCFSELLDIDLI